MADLTHVSGAEVAAYLRENLGDSIPLDLHLSGVEIAAAIKAAKPLVEIPVSVHVSRDAILKAVAAATSGPGAGGNGGGTNSTPPPAPNPITTVAYGGVNDGTTNVDSALWTAKTTGNYFTATTYKQRASDVLRILTPSTVQTYSGYAKIQGKTSQQSGKVSGSFTTQNKNEHRFYVGAFCSADPNNGNQPDGWYLNILPVSNLVQFSRLLNGTETIIGTSKTITFASGGDTVRWEIQPGLGATLWLNGATKPSTPNFPADGGTTPAFPQSAAGTVFLQINSGGTPEVIQFDHSAITFDALDGPHLAAAPSDAAISGDLTKPYAPTGVKNQTWVNVWEDTFTGSALDTSKWVDREPYQGLPGYGDSDIWHPLPYTSNELTVAGGNLTMKVRKGSSLPSGAVYTGSQLSTRGKFATPQLANGDKLYIECRIKVPSGRALWPSLWTEGDGDLHVANDSHTGWPVKGENDLFEFFNNKGGQYTPFWSLHFPGDMTSNPPGTWLNDAHSYQQTPPNAALCDSFHTWGLLVEDSQLQMYVDGALVWTYAAGQTYNGVAITQAIINLFRAPQFIRLSLEAGGYAGQGWTRPSQWDEGDMVVDYVRVFKHLNGS